ncbi:MAG: Asp23/Gls24 family envelope stress response protein [Lachnospiraceae bacterium]|nr:Asp23/Gls24 family envelope stress response protein [Lachnospiraceae bacterium]
MNGRLKNEYGNVLIDKSVLAEYAGYAAMETLGVVGMAVNNVKDGAMKILKRENAGQGISVEIVDNRIKLTIHIIVAYGVNIKAVAQNLLDNVKGRLEANTGLEVEYITIIIDGVKNIDVV